MTSMWAQGDLVVALQQARLARRQTLRRARPAPVRPVGTTGRLRPAPAR